MSPVGNFTSRYTPAEIEDHQRAKERRLRMDPRKPPVLTPPPAPAPAPAALVSEAAPDPAAPMSRKITTRDVIMAVADRYAIRVDYMMGRRRFREYVRPKQIALYLTRELCPRLSLPQIGRAFNRDHTTVLYAIGKIRSLRSVDGDLDAEIKALMAHIASLPPPKSIPAPVIATESVPVYRAPIASLIGRRYGRLVVIGLAGACRPKTGVLHHLWNCQCDCGKTRVRRTAYFMSKTSTMSCGCVLREKAFAHPRVGGRFVAMAV
jgi:hypothetical protein